MSLWYFHYRIGKVIAFVVCATIIVIVITIVCCCCCPFCILAKRKERGRVLRQGPPTQPQQPTHNPGVVTQQGYTVPTEQYQQQMVPQPYPNAGYNQPVPPSGPYGNQGNLFSFWCIYYYNKFEYCNISIVKEILV